MRRYVTATGDHIRNMLMPLMQRFSPRMRTISAVSILVAVVLSAVTLGSMELVLRTQSEAEGANAAYQTCQDAASTFQDASNSLTSESRSFIASGDRAHLDSYLAELQLVDRREDALETLRAHARSERAVAALEGAREKSDTLAQTELYALRLAAEGWGLTDLPPALADLTLEEWDASLASSKKRTRAYQLVHDAGYTTLMLEIRTQVQACSDELLAALRLDVERSTASLGLLLAVMRGGVIGLVLVVGLAIGSSTLLLTWPMSLFEESIRQEEPLVPGGARELRLLADAYNDMYAINQHRTESLSFEAHNDALTGALNRGAFESLLTEHKATCALILVDIDFFKQFNDEYGHEMGDAILIEVVATLFSAFRASDFVCRIGGDEFAVIMTGVTPAVRDIVAHKIGKLAAFLRDTSNGLPAATVSVGVAFGRDDCTDDGLFQEADKALYEVKRRGRDGLAFAGEL